MLFRKIALAVCLSFLIISLSGCRSTTPQDIEKLADSLYGELNDSRETASASVLVVKDGKKILEKSYGHKNIETGELATPNTSYRLGCLSKYFTAVSILILQEQGALELDWKVNKILKDFPDYAKDVTIADLMNNTSRLPAIYDLYPEDGKFLKDRDLYEIIKQHPEAYFPETAYAQISNETGFVILALIVEEVSGQRFEDFLQENIFTPLGMNNSVALVEGYNSVGDRAYGTVNKNGRLVIGDQYAYSTTLGDGGIYSNVYDMYLWDQAIDNHQIISEKTFEDAIESGKFTQDWQYLNQFWCYDSSSNQPTKFSCGWYVTPQKGCRSLWTEGGSIGFSSMYVKIPEKNVSVIILTNLGENWSIIKDSNALIQAALDCK